MDTARGERLAGVETRGGRCQYRHLRDYLRCVAGGEDKPAPPTQRSERDGRSAVDDLPGGDGEEHVVYRDKLAAPTNLRLHIFHPVWAPWVAQWMDPSSFRENLPSEGSGSHADRGRLLFL